MTVPGKVFSGGVVSVSGRPAGDEKFGAGVTTDETRGHTGPRREKRDEREEVRWSMTGVDTSPLRGHVPYRFPTFPSVPKGRKTNPNPHPIPRQNERILFHWG